MTTRGIFTAALCTALLAVGGAGTYVSAAASTAVQVLPIDHSARYLVYEAVSSSDNAAVEVRTKDGLVSTLTTVDPLQQYPSSNGAFVTFQAFSAPLSGPKDVNWWDLTTAESGTMTVPEGARNIAATRYGVEFVGTDAAHPDAGKALFEETPDGTVTSYGDPFPQADGLSAVAGPGGVVVVDASSGDTAYLPYGATTYQPLAGATGLADGDVYYCSSATRVLVSCEINQSSGGHVSVVMPLDGGPVLSTSRCEAANLFGSRVLCQANAHHGLVRSKDGTWRTVRVPGGLIGGCFGQILLVNQTRTKIKSVASARATDATVLARASG
jgi:hypothetical protein